MVIDTSALIAILGYETEAAHFAAAIQADPVRRISAGSLLECAIVIEARYGQPGGDKLDQLVAAAQIRVEPVTAEQVAAARLAYRTYGKGHHPAALNFGDCFARLWQRSAENRYSLRAMILVKRIFSRCNRIKAQTGA